jgi:four helix bundle protein
MKSSYRDLIAWQKAMDLVDSIYSLVLTFPKYELFGLSAQMRSAATSIPINIAEGQGRYSLRDFRRFLRDSRASALELETEILIAVRQKYVSPGRGDALIDECLRVAQLVNGLLRHISKRIRAERPTANGQRPTSKNPSGP